MPELRDDRLAPTRSAGARGLEYYLPGGGASWKPARMKAVIFQISLRVTVALKTPGFENDLQHSPSHSGAKSSSPL